MASGVLGKTTTAAILGRGFKESPENQENLEEQDAKSLRLGSLPNDHPEKKEWMAERERVARASVEEKARRIRHSGQWV